jgi:hypothetical protein
MKNGKLVTAYMDECEVLNALKKRDQEAWIARSVDDPHDDLWRACISGGWTVAELDAAFARRFGRVVRRDA